MAGFWERRWNQFGLSVSVSNVFEGCKVLVGVEFNRAKGEGWIKREGGGGGKVKGRKGERERR